MMRVGSFASSFLASNANRSYALPASHQQQDKDNDKKISGLNGFVHNIITKGKGSSSQDRIKNLTERKQSIEEMARQYSQDARKEGVSEDTIQAKLDEYESMKQEIDAQITQIRQSEEAKKKQESQQAVQTAQAVSQSKTGSSSKDSGTNDMAQAARQMLIAGAAAFQNAVDAVHSIKSAQNILQDQELSMKASANFTPSKKTRQKAAESGAKAKALDGDIAKQVSRMRNISKQISESSDSSGTKYQTDSDFSQSTQPKTYEQEAAENYQHIADLAEPQSVEEEIDFYA